MLIGNCDSKVNIACSEPFTKDDDLDIFGAYKLVMDCLLPWLNPSILQLTDFVINN